MESYFFLAPFLSFLFAGLIKFIINSLKIRKLAFKKIGLGNFPSTHNAISSSAFFTVLFQEGLNSPFLSIAFALMLIVAIDSLDLRNKIEKHAKAINELEKPNGFSFDLRTKIGHKPIEVFGGFLVGITTSYLFFLLVNGA